jgi:hypothetical protein
MENELVKSKRPLTASDIKAQVQLIQEVMKAVMEKDVHYGIIPGTPKPTLYKAGAEKLLSTFRIGVDPREEVVDLSTEDEIRYRVSVKGFSQGTGDLLGVGIGECSSSEEKYKWKKPVCGEEFNETAPERKRTVWKHGKDKPYQLQQIRMNPIDVANTILKMAKKRALIDMTLTITAASDIFDQDLEDLPDGMEVGNGKKPPIQEPQKKKTPDETEKPKTETVVTGIDNVTKSDGVDKNKKPYTKYTVYVGETKYSTFSDTVAADAKKANQAGLQTTIEYKTTKFGPEIVTLTVEEPPEDGNAQE